MAYKIVDLRNKLPTHKTKFPKTRNTVDTIVVHCTASSNQDINKTALYDITPSPNNHICSTGAPTYTYSDCITKDGTLNHCVSYKYITWHAGLYNTRSIGVVLAYEGIKGISPTEAQMITLEQHLTFLCLYFHVSPKRIFGHREIPGMYTIIGKGDKKYKKWCPGDIDLDKLRKDITMRLQCKLSAMELYKGPIDGDFGPLSKNALNNFKPDISINWNWPKPVIKVKELLNVH